MIKNNKGEVAVRDVLGILVIIALIVNGFYFAVSTVGNENLGYNVSVNNPCSDVTNDVLGYDNNSLRANVTTLKEGIAEDGATQADPNAFLAPIKIIFNIGGFVLGSFGIVSDMISTVSTTLGVPTWAISGITTLALVSIVFIIISAYNKYRT